jgi:hypothetical protein
MIGLWLLFTSFVLSLWIWLFRIRSYVMHSGRTPLTRLSLGMSVWVDWQQCWRIAKAKKDARGLQIAQWFLVWQIAFLLGLVLIVCGI